MAGRDEQEVLSPRALNRALLERQMLLRRVPMPPAAAIEHLVGLQAQTPNSYYFGLWSRLDGFRHDDLTRLIVGRRAVRIVVMRGTIHLLTPRDCVTLRALTQPMLERAIRGVFGQQLQGVDLGVLVEQGRALLDERPRTANEIGAALARRWPRHDPSTLAQAVRGLVPLVQVPPRGLWGRTGPAAHVTLEAWLGRPMKPRVTDRDRERLVTRYLAAFGPSTVADIRAWSGLAGLGEVVLRLRNRLRVLRDASGRELFDLPDAPRPGPDEPAPPRFLPEFDNVLLAHADRTRIVADRHRRQLFRGAGLLTGTVLLDGFVGARWRIERTRKAATLIVTVFERQSAPARAAVIEEGRRLLAFACADSEDHAVRIERRH